MLPRPAVGGEFEIVGGAERPVELHALGLVESHDGLRQALSYESPTVPLGRRTAPSARARH